ncbi:hypothetical protein BKA66DRAFT_569654 [Pyrenochaeta sp. MPI-SDFR-AT-0127]|nr:hypothetical protein BKA66DRAFT_569654 [Pyrenochaeta sp. MPI-SDFR-AT-0127]
MGAVELAVDAAAEFLGPFMDKNRKYSAGAIVADHEKVVTEALSHLHAINSADLTSEPDAPYDASLAGVVYGLLDLVTLLGILPHLSPGVAFYQRPKSVLVAPITAPASGNKHVLSRIALSLIPILEQTGLGIQSLLSQRMLPDILSALAELLFSPTSKHETQSEISKTYQKLIFETPTSRLLPILTTFLQQPLPMWLKPIISKELAVVPLRPQGVRHTIEFLSLSYLTKHSQVPHDTSSPHSQLPIPLEAVTQASRLLVLPPSGYSQETWLCELAPQLLRLLDGNEGRELSRAAGQIVASGILSKKTTGAPGTVGWDLFALPLLQVIYPKDTKELKSQMSDDHQMIVPEQELRSALMRLSAIASSYSHAGLLKRLVGPLLLPLWALLNYARLRPSLNKEWSLLPQAILSRYILVACDAAQVDGIATNLFWDGYHSWTFGPGSQGGVEIRKRSEDSQGMADMSHILTRIGDLDSRINLLVSLLAEAQISDVTAGSIFIQVTRRWLSPGRKLETSLTDELDIEPLSALTDAKLSEALATKFKDNFARSPQHIIALMGQLIQNFVDEQKVRIEHIVKSKTSSRAILENIIDEQERGVAAEEETAEEDLSSFALSILSTLVASEGFKQTSETWASLQSLFPALTYLAQQQSQLPVSALIRNAAINLLGLIKPTSSDPANLRTVSDPMAELRMTLETTLSDLTSPEPPNRTWALNSLHKIIQNPDTFPIIDVPSLAHLLLSASLADPESYVHTAAIPVLVDLAIRAPYPVINLLSDAFIDLDERSLSLVKGMKPEDKERALQHALDFRLRVGEVLNKITIEWLWKYHSNSAQQHRSLKQISEACLSLASRRGQRNKTLSTRVQLAEAEQKVKEEGEAAWGGPIPNLLSLEDDDPREQTERAALLRIVQGWEENEIEEDVRIRASALSVLSTVFEYRLDLLRQHTVDVTLQMVLLILTIETSEAKALLRRAGILVVMGLLRNLDSTIEGGKESAVAMSLKQQEEIDSILKWVKDQDVDELVRDHAASVVEGLETLRMKKLYRLQNEGLRLGPDLGLEGNLRGLIVKPGLGNRTSGEKKLIVEEIE